jgi:hypothetical protein
LEHLFQQTLQYHSYSLLFALQEALFADTKLGLFSDDVRLINANQGESALPTCNLQSVCTLLAPPLLIADVACRGEREGKQTYLKIRLFNPHYLFISIDLRSGRFLLKAPVGVIDQGTPPYSVSKIAPVHAHSCSRQIS